MGLKRNKACFGVKSLSNIHFDSKADGLNRGVLVVAVCNSLDVCCSCCVVNLLLYPARFLLINPAHNPLGGSLINPSPTPPLYVVADRWRYSQHAGGKVGNGASEGRHKRLWSFIFLFFYWIVTSCSVTFTNYTKECVMFSRTWWWWLIVIFCTYNRSYHGHTKYLKCPRRFMMEFTAIMQDKSIARTHLSFANKLVGVCRGCLRHSVRNSPFWLVTSSWFGKEVLQTYHKISNKLKRTITNFILLTVSRLFFTTLLFILIEW